MVAGRSLSPFQLDAGLRAQLSRVGKAVFKCKGTWLFRRGDSPKGVFLLVSGKVTLSAGGAATVHHPCLPGCLLGLPATVGNRSYGLTAKCAEDCECIRVSHEEFTALLCANPAFCLRVVEILANEVRELRSRLPVEARKARAGWHRCAAYLRAESVSEQLTQS